MLHEHTESNPATEKRPAVKGIFPLERDLDLLRWHLTFQRHQLVIVAAKCFMYSFKVFMIVKNKEVLCTSVSFSIVPTCKKKQLIGTECMEPINVSSRASTTGHDLRKSDIIVHDIIKKYYIIFNEIL